MVIPESQYWNVILENANLRQALQEIKPCPVYMEQASDGCPPRAWVMPGVCENEPSLEAQTSALALSPTANNNSGYMPPANPFLIDNTAGLTGKRGRTVGGANNSVSKEDAELFLYFVERANQSPITVNKTTPPLNVWTSENEAVVQDTFKWMEQINTDITVCQKLLHVYDVLGMNEKMFAEWNQKYQTDDRGIKFRKAHIYIRKAINKWIKKNNRMLEKQTLYHGRKPEPQTLDEWVTQQDENNAVPGYVKIRYENGDIVFKSEKDNKLFLYAP